MGRFAGTEADKRGGEGATTTMTALLLRVALVAGLALLVLGATHAQPAPAAPGWQWNRVDTHTHQALSADAYVDLGILSKRAKEAGYNALFVTDHGLGSDFPINNLTANHMVFEDSYTRWTPGVYGAPSPNVNELAWTPIKTGARSLHLQAGGSGEAFVWTKRGPNLRSGDIIVKVSIYPTQIDAGSGIYVSASLGGDPRVDPKPNGYTTQAGVISPGKSTLLVWQLGAARAPSSDPNRRVLTYDLGPYTLNAWNTYTINVSDALADIPAADRPLDYNGFTHLKMAAAANGGNAEAYFDSYAIDASQPVPPNEEFVYRNSVIHAHDTDSFKLFPSIELGVNKHINRFNFGIANPSEFVHFPAGIDGILPSQQTLYPAQLNHPGVPGGVTTEEAVQGKGIGADLIEVGKEEIWTEIWDDILAQGVQIIGTGSTDKHEASYGASSFSTVIYAPSLGFDALIRSMFEGRAYILTSTIGRLVFNVPGSDAEPYPARYPVYVSDSRNTADAHLSISNGLATSQAIRWISNDQLIASDTPAGPAYAATKPVDLAGSSTYVRAEVRSSTGQFLAATEPIFFKDVTGLPAGMSFNVDGVTTADGRGYTKVFTKGITEAAWSSADESLALTLTNRAESLGELSARTGSKMPWQVIVDGSEVARATSLGEFQASGGSSWHYDGGAGLLRLKVRQASATAGVRVDFGTPPPDTEPPSKPAGLTATVQGSGRIDLAWSASADNVGVTAYRVRRDGAPLATLDGGTLAFADATVAPGSSYSYTVEAGDAAGNWSPPSDAAGATTAAASTTLAFTPVADSYVESPNPATYFGASTKLRTDGSPDVRSYLRFNLSGLGSNISDARLRVYAHTANTTGYDVRGVSDTLWGETTTNFNNAPAVGAIAGASAPITAGSWTEVDVTSLITGNGLRSLALTSRSATATSFASRESGALAPQLIVTTF